ncbi:hypothetical protein [Candidatus Uabimicrobium sp. HlEnr_7]|uniref:hypothetical protein n=1 Tax=Candidatus Uabimicrobium helgolandensis TaxID=3095367 RepID=UPI0035581EA2
MILNAEEKFANCPNKGNEMGKYHGTFSGRCDICYYPLIIETQKEKTYTAIHPDQMYCNCGCKFDLLHFPRRIFCEVCDGTWKVKGNYCVDCDDEIDNKRKEKKCNRCLKFYEKHGVSYLCNSCQKQLGVSWLKDKNESIWVCNSCKFLQNQRW